MIRALLALLFAQAAVQSGRIEGIVMKAGTIVQQTLPNARLELRDGPGTPLIVRTDVAGRFVFPNLSPGRYRLLLTEDGSIRQEYGEVLLTPSQPRRDIVFKLEPAPTIAGSITDQSGIPISNILVQALRRTYDIRGNPRLTLSASAITDDRGQYRIFWVDPGDYFVNAGFTPLQTAGEPEESTTRPTYAPVYFPGVNDPEGTKPIRVALGREINGVDFRLRRQDLATVSGYVTSAVTRKPISAAITLSPVEEANVGRHQAQSSAEGTFGIRDVAPGSYIVSARSGGSAVFAGFQRIRIPSVIRPFLDLRLILNPGRPVHGRIYFSGAESSGDFRRMRVALASIDFLSPVAVSPQADGQFSIADVFPDEYLLTVTDLPDDVYVAAACYGSVDALEAAVSIRNNDAASALQILLDSRGGRLTSAVFDRENRPLPRAQVVLVPDATRRHRPDQYRVIRAGDDGRVTIRGIPPGDYKVLAWENIEPNAHLNREYLRSYEDFGIAVRIASGDNSPVAVRSIPSEQ